MAAPTEAELACAARSGEHWLK